MLFFVAGLMLTKSAYVSCCSFIGSDLVFFDRFEFGDVYVEICRFLYLYDSTCERVKSLQKIEFIGEIFGK